MKFIKQILVFCFILIAVIFPRISFAQSQDTKNFTLNQFLKINTQTCKKENPFGRFCTDPYQFICEDNITRPAIKFEGGKPLRLYSFRENAEEAAFEEAKTRIASILELDPKKVTYQDVTESLNSWFTSKKKSDLVKLTLIQTALKKVKTLTGNHNRNDASYFSKAIFQFKKKFNETIAGTNFSQEEKNKMGAAVDAVQVLTPFDFDSSGGHSKNDQYLHDYLELCFDKQEINTFVDNGEVPALSDKIVFLCPHDLEENYFENPLNPAVFLEGTLAHEFGHILYREAYTRASSVFDPIASCMNAHGNDLINEKLGWMKRQSAANSLVKQSDEMIADTWAAEYIAHDILKNQYGASAKMHLLQYDLQSYCTGDDPQSDGHPSGRYRIENLFRSNPHLSEALECGGDTPKNPTVNCDFNGQVTHHLHPFIKPKPTPHTYIYHQWEGHE